MSLVHWKVGDLAFLAAHRCCIANQNIPQLDDTDDVADENANTLEKVLLMRLTFLWHHPPDLRAGTVQYNLVTPADNPSLAHGHSVYL